MEAWTELAGTVPVTLLRVAEGTIGLLGTLDSADQKLAAFIQFLRSFLRGDIAAISRGGDNVRQQARAGPVLENARRELVRVRELHGMAGQVFFYCCITRQGLVASPLWQTWAEHSIKTSRHASEALQSLRSAASYLEASKDAYAMARSSPFLSPEWAAWLAAALNLVRRAIWAEKKAVLAATKMRNAVTVEMVDARMVLLNR